MNSPVSLVSSGSYFPTLPAPLAEFSNTQTTTSALYPDSAAFEAYYALLGSISQAFIDIEMQETNNETFATLEKGTLSSPNLDAQILTFPRARLLISYRDFGRLSYGPYRYIEHSQPPRRGNQLRRSRRIVAVLPYRIHRGLGENGHLP